MLAFDRNARQPKDGGHGLERVHNNVRRNRISSGGMHEPSYSARGCRCGCHGRRKWRGCSGKKRLAFVVNASSDFWKLAEAGVKKAQTELPNYELQFRYPAQGTAALQNALMDDLVAAGVDAIMISSADPKNSIDAFNKIAAQVPLFTTDSDATGVQPHRLSRIVKHRSGRAGRRGNGESHGRQGRQVHGLRRIPRRG